MLQHAQVAVVVVGIKRQTAVQVVVEKVEIVMGIRVLPQLETQVQVVAVVGGLELAEMVVLE
jgi:hypothetical protein